MYWNFRIVSLAVGVSGLIETWDVLKYNRVITLDTTKLINRNMRCIEIIKNEGVSKNCVGLIETWDVLKLSLFFWKF